MNATVDCNAGPLGLVRPDLRDFAGYRSARSDKFEGSIWLNANESAWANAATDACGARRYPDPQPPRLRALMAELYGCAPEQLLIGRGSDECIDLLVRALCRPGQDAIVTTPPTFGMYAVSARLHATALIEVPLRDQADGFRADFDAIALVARTEAVKLVFLCSPGNPSGSALALDDIAALAQQLDGKALVVVDEAYGEFSEVSSAVSLLAIHRNIVVLRTLSKAHALAGARIGCVIADADLITVLQRCQAPYPIPSPCAALALAALEPAAREVTSAHVATVLEQRTLLQRGLEKKAGVRCVYPSAANFLLVRFDNAQAAFDRLLRAGVVVRDMRMTPGLHDALRITIGSTEQNEAVLAALDGIVDGVLRIGSGQA